MGEATLLVDVAPGRSSVSLLATIAVIVLAVFIGLIVLKFAISLAMSLFWPLLLVTIGVGIGVWWMSRRRRA